MANKTEQFKRPHDGILTNALCHSVMQVIGPTCYEIKTNHCHTNINDMKSTHQVIKQLTRVDIDRKRGKIVVHQQ